MTLSLDHVGYVGASMAAMRQTMRRLGFAPTEPRELMAVDAATGVARSLQQHSCHIVLEHGYLELSAISNPAPGHHLAPWLLSAAGLKILAFGAPDIEGVRAATAANGLACSKVMHASRRIDYGARHGDAQFRWFMLEAAASPEGLICVVRNETPELVFQPEVTAHPNTARRLVEVVLMARDVESLAARYSALTGASFAAGAHGRTAPLAEGALTLGTAADIAVRFGATAAAPLGAEPRGAPRDAIAAIVIQVADIEAATRSLSAGDVGFERRGDAIIVAAAQACGAALVFRP